MDSIPTDFWVTALLVSVVLAVTALGIMRLPTVPAYFIAGLFAGPNALGILHSGGAVDFAAELGVILLLFAIGLKFNIGALNSIRRAVFFLGGAQVAATAVVVGGLAWLWLGDPFIASLVGFVAAMSSTAIVSQILIEDNIVSSPVGRRAMGVLLFQDLVVIPLIIIYSNDKFDVSPWLFVPLLLAKIGCALGFAVFFGPRLMRRWLNWVAHFGDKDLFVLHVVFIIILSSVVTHILGLSHALGAFLSGMLIAETFHRHRVEQIIEPFRQLFLGFFFVTLGVLVNVRDIADSAALIVLLAAILTALKIPIVYAFARAHPTMPGDSLKTALLLGGAGEFGFVLLTVSNNSGVLPDALFQALVPANMLALVATPFLWRRADALVGALFKSDWLASSQSIANAAAKTAALQGHVIVCGFGRTGQAVVGILRHARAKFVVLESDHLILEAVGETGHVIYGKGDRAESLLAAGVMRAKALIVTYSEQAAAAVTAQTARRLNPNVHIIGKAESARQADALIAAGANESLVGAHQSGLSLAGQCLRRIQIVNDGAVNDAFAAARSRQDPIFRGEFSGLGEGDESAAPPRFVGCKASPAAEGKALADIAAGATVVSWRRGEKELSLADESRRLQSGDELVFSGEAAALEAARQRLTADHDG